MPKTQNIALKQAIKQILNEYYNLLVFPSVPRQIFKALTDSSTGTGAFISLAKFQLGLCYISGFGTNVDPRQGLDLIHEAATLGLRRARATITRFHRAFGIPIPYPSRETYFSWLSESAHLGSRIAVDDLAILFPDRTTFSRGSSKLPNGRWSGKLVALCEVVRRGGKTHISPQDVSIGPNGDSILHWCAFLPRNMGGSVAALLISHGCTPTTVTRTECPLGDRSDEDSYCEVMPSRTTPIDWAIIEDNLEVLKVLLQVDQGTHGATIESPALTPATCAARFQRIDCLRYILESGYNASERDEAGCSPMFHAARPDMFARILQFSEPFDMDPYAPWGSVQQSAFSICPPFVRLEIDILKLLQNHGASLKACHQDDFNYLHLSVVAKDSRVLEHLLATEDLGTYIDQNAKGEWSPLSYAIALGNERAVDLLLKDGANINQLSSLQGYNALHICTIYARPNSAEIASRLINQSHKLVNSRSRSGYTALHFAAVAGSVSLMNILAKRGAHLMAASNRITPLGLAIAYWSELGVKEICSIHMEKGVPLVAAFDETFFSLSPSPSIGPLTMVLGWGRKSGMNTVREFRGGSSWAGCYDPPLHGPAENIVRIVLRYPASGRWLDFFKIWYYQVTEQYSPTDDMDSLQKVELFFGFAFGSFWFLIYGADEFCDAVECAVAADDSRAVEIILAESSQKKPLANLRKLILTSQTYISWKPVQERQNSLRAADLLIELEHSNHSELKLQRTNGRMRVLWRLIYRLYLDIEQKEYMRFNDWVIHERPDMARLKTEFRSWLPSQRVPTYPFSFMIMWAILGQMLYHMPGFLRNIDKTVLTANRVSTDNRVWTAFLVIIVSIGSCQTGTRLTER